MKDYDFAKDFEEYADTHGVPMSGIDTPRSPTLTKHAVAELFNLSLSDKEKDDEALEADIREHGLRVPIVTYQGQVLDGYRRYCACLKLGVKPDFTVYTGSDPLAEVMSLNGHRRHLTKTQVAAMKALCANPELQAKHGGKRAKACATPLVTAISQAEDSGCGATTQREVNKVVAADREVGKQMAAGAVTLLEGKAIAFPERSGTTTAAINSPPPRHERIELFKAAMSKLNATFPKNRRAPAKVIQLYEKQLTTLDKEIGKRDARIESLEAELRERELAATASRPNAAAE